MQSLDPRADVDPNDSSGSTDPHQQFLQQCQAARTQVNGDWERAQILSQTMHNTKQEVLGIIASIREVHSARIMAGMTGTQQTPEERDKDERLDRALDTLKRDVKFMSVLMRLSSWQLISCQASKEHVELRSFVAQMEYARGAERVGAMVVNIQRWAQVADSAVGEMEHAVQRAAVSLVTLRELRDSVQGIWG